MKANMNFGSHTDFEIFISRNCANNPRRRYSAKKRTGKRSESHGWLAFEFIRENEGLTVAEYLLESPRFNLTGIKEPRHLKYDFERGRLYLKHPETGEIIRTSVITASEVWSAEELEVIPASDELEKRVGNLRPKALTVKPEGQSLPRKTQSTVTSFYRDPLVKAWVLENANGVCELCNANAPFTDKHGFPFLEVHHVHTLAEGGSDTIENAAALCPNCHRRCHYGEDMEKALKELRLVVLKHM